MEARTKEKRRSGRYLTKLLGGLAIPTDSKAWKIQAGGEVPSHKIDYWLV